MIGVRGPTVSESKNREAVPSSSPGLPLRLPWDNANEYSYNRKAVAAAVTHLSNAKDATALRLEMIP